MIEHKDLDDLFSHHPPPNERVVRAHEGLRNFCRSTAAEVLRLTPLCPEQTLAIRKLEEAMFWANAAVARNHGHYDADPTA